MSNRLISQRLNADQLVLDEGFLFRSRRRSRNHLKHYRPPPSSSTKLSAGATLPGDPSAAGSIAGYGPRKDDAYLSVKLPGALRIHDTLPGSMSQRNRGEQYESEDNEYAYVDDFQFPVATGNCSQGQRANESAHPYGLLSRPACELGAECVGSCHENNSTQHDANSQGMRWHHQMHLQPQQAHQPQQPEQLYYESRDGRSSSLPRDLIRKC